MAASPLAGVKNRCDWGQKAWSMEDSKPCSGVAVGIVAVLGEGGILRLDLCSSHRVLVLEETSPLDP